MKLFGLIGKTLEHSFSKRYFTQKFEKMGLQDHRYELFELSAIEEFENLINTRPELVGLNVTIPYKKTVMDHLTDVSPEARRIGAVNTIKLDTQGQRVGYNTDYFGFYHSLVNWLDGKIPRKALVLGTGGASLAVTAALKDLGMEITLVSRKASSQAISYQQLKSRDLDTFQLIVNTTPLGMAPHVQHLPDLQYHQLGAAHYLYDLVYNPEITAFLERGRQQQTRIKGGLEMLRLQAEKAWEIWTT